MSMTTRKIIHVDMDCFYAAIEIRDNPQLRGLPVAVGGEPGRRGVLTTCSYEARQYGLHSAMASATAIKRCPDLIILPVQMDKYVTVSRSIQAIFKEFTDDIEPLSLDEAFLDVSHSDLFRGSATLIAAAIRQRIYEKEQLQASAGIAPNKFLAKIASDWRKPNGQFVITPDEVPAFMQTLPVKKIFGVGKVTAKKMHGLGISTCADLQAMSQNELIQHFARFGHSLYKLSRGIDERPVRMRGERKSLSVENTFIEDVPNLKEALEKLPALFTELQHRLARANKKQHQHIKSLVVKLKFNDFTLTTAQTPGTQPNLETYAQLLKQAWERKRRPMRLIGLGVHFHTEQAIAQSAQLDLL